MKSTPLKSYCDVLATSDQARRRALLQLQPAPTQLLPGPPDSERNTGACAPAENPHSGRGLPMDF